MRHRRLLFAVAILLPTIAAAQQMYLDTRQGRTTVDYKECMARAKRALQVEAWGIGGEYGANVRGGHLVAWKGQHGVIFGCDVEPNGNAFWTMTMSGVNEGNHPLMDALGKHMGTPSTTPAGPVAPEKSCWDWYGEFLDGRVVFGTPQHIVMTSDNTMTGSWGWKGKWKADGGGGYRFTWEARTPDQDDVMRMAGDGRSMEGKNFETRIIRGTRRACP